MKLFIKYLERTKKINYKYDKKVVQYELKTDKKKIIQE